MKCHVIAKPPNAPRSRGETESSGCLVREDQRQPQQQGKRQQPASDAVDCVESDCRTRDDDDPPAEGRAEMVRMRQCVADNRCASNRGRDRNGEDNELDSPSRNRVRPPPMFRCRCCGRACGWHDQPSPDRALREGCATSAQVVNQLVSQTGASHDSSDVLSGPSYLLPLYGARGLAGDVENDAIDGADLVGDSS
jgi:hypothetical protein